MGVPPGITGCLLIALLSARLLPASRRISDFVAHICISNISDGSTGRDLNIVTITKNNLMRRVRIRRNLRIRIEKFREIILRCSENDNPGKWKR